MTYSAFPFRRPAATLSLAIAMLALAGVHPGRGAETWRGLTVTPEHRCSPYHRSLYPYPQSVERQIVATMQGRIYGPYTGRYFRSTRQTDIDHIVAVSEAHDSGLCSATAAERRRFAADLLNLTLAAPEVNRCGPRGKCAHDPSAWLPPHNRCWFAARVVAVKRSYRLTVDRREAAALDRVLHRCPSTEMQFAAPKQGREANPRPSSRAPATPAAGQEALQRYDDNRNGRIACAEARRHGIAPVRRDHPPTASCTTATATESSANSIPPPTGDPAIPAQPGPLHTHLIWDSTNSRRHQEQGRPRLPRFRLLQAGPFASPTQPRITHASAQPYRRLRTCPLGLHAATGDRRRRSGRRQRDRQGSGILHPRPSPAPYGLASSPSPKAIGDSRTRPAGSGTTPGASSIPSTSQSGGTRAAGAVTTTATTLSFDGHFHVEDQDGNHHTPALHMRHPDAPRCFCLGAAIRIHTGDIAGLNPSSLGDLVEQICLVYVNVGKLQQHLQFENTFEPYLEAVIHWNDQPSRTFREIHSLAQGVIAHLDAARFGSA